MRIVFMGTPEFAVPSLDMLVNQGYEIAAVVTQPDKPKGRGKKLSSPPVKEYAQKHDLMVLQPENVKTEEFIETLRNLAPDLMITAAYGKILPKAVLDIPRMGCINVHASLLPKYRGAAPINWAIINGETKTGITIMQTDVGMDTGDILLVRETEIHPDMTAGELHDKLAVLGAEVLKEALEKIKEGTIQRIPQKHEDATYAPMMNKEMGLIDWKKPAQSIHNLIRGTNPWPGAYTYYKGKRVKVWKSRIEPCIINCSDELSECSQGTCTIKADAGHELWKPGTIVRREKEGLVIACGSGCLILLEIQFDDCKKLCIDECWHNFSIGEVLG